MAQRKKSGPVVVRTSQMADELRPVLVKFMRGLRYTKTQGEAFASGYLDEVAKLPMLAKLRALSQQDDRCMTAGFKAAGIKESEALKRARAH